MLIIVRQESEQDQTHIFPNTHFESGQIHQLIIIYCFEQQITIFS